MHGELKFFLDQMLKGKQPDIGMLKEDAVAQLSFILNNVHAISVAVPEEASAYMEMIEWLYALSKWHPRAQNGLPSCPSKATRDFFTELMSDYEREAINAGVLEEGSV